MGFGAIEKVLCHMSVPAFPARELIPAAAKAGFDAVSMLARPHQRFLAREGLTNEELRRILADSGLVVTDFEAAGDWLSEPESEGPAFLRSTYTSDQCLDAAAALGARTLVAVHFGAPSPVEEAAEPFARLCDKAAKVGVDVALEFPAMATIADVGTAWDVVRVADRPNGGVLLDTWHHRRSVAGDAELAEVPADRVLSIQLRDGTAEPIGPPVKDVLISVMPGDGDFGLAALLHDVFARGVSCPVGIEVLDGDIVKQGADRAAATLFGSLSRVLDDASVVAQGS